MAHSVLITGGSSGIGRALVERFVREDFEVSFTYRTGEARARDLIASLSDRRVQAFHFDQGERNSHQALLAELPRHPDIAIFNAGLGSATVTAYAAEARADEDEALIRVNATGVLWLAQAVLPSMLDRGFGKLVFISSVLGGITQFAGFRLADGMGKAAVAFLARQMAAELAHSPVDVFAICPGATETPMLEASTLSAMAPDTRRAFLERLPKHRLAQPAEIAELACFLCSPQGRILHGAVLDASLGLGVHPGLVTG
ncbi:MAG TPA: SDR family oxidoreductase [Vicinamibacteria bacterium]|nr:SDR family oxidoreductase [Vicinamibacteria bacterium]